MNKTWGHDGGRKNGVDATGSMVSAVVGDGVLAGSWPLASPVSW